jgi:malonyl CoA-acyl carrier protein transacylase
MAISLGILCVLALAATGISFFALLCTRALATDVCRRVSDLESTMQSALRATEGKLAELAAEARDRESQSPVTVLPARLRLGLNMTIRSQALRLHRHGESAENIAKVLEVPRQEVDLLLKVHGIVIKGI